MTTTGERRPPNDASERGGRPPGRGRRRRRRRPDRPAPRPAPVVPETSELRGPGAGGDLLSPDEVAEMKQHLVFLRTYKEALRLKLNAAEDLLVNGQREPSERGVCRHLIGKVDRGVIERALAREPLHSDPAARARMLAGAVRLTADVGTLLDYLETLTHVRTRPEAAQAFAEVVRRIDFAGLSATRLARLLQVLLDTFTGHEQIQVLFSLLAAPAFRKAFDAGLPEFPPTVAGSFAPLRAVHRRLLGEKTGADDPALLALGLEQLLSAPDPILRGYAEPARVGMLELALDPAVPPRVADRAAGVLLASLPRQHRTYADLALRRAAQLLERHVDDRARAVLGELHRAQPGLPRATRWLAALDARRVGRLALAGAAPAGSRLAPAFWLDGQCPAWVRTASADDAAHLAAEARLQRGAGLPGVAPVVEDGTASGIAYVGVAAPGQPLAALDPAGIDAQTAFALPAAVARILHALALAGIALPDAALGRFLHVGGRHSSALPLLVLADFDGAWEADPAEAADRHAGLVIAVTRRLVPERRLAHLAPAVGERLRRALDGSPTLADLVGVLDEAALRSARD